MPHTHAPTKAEACEEAVATYQQEHHASPDAHEKARILSDAIKEWEHEHLVETHPTAAAR